MTKNTKNKKNAKFTWNVWVWDINHDKLETYDVVPMFLNEYKSLKKNEKPKTREEFDEFLGREARYHFWAKCEYEMVIHSWPMFKNDEKVDVYQQLMLNWDVFVDCFWNSINGITNADHRKQRGRTAPNKAVKK